MIQGFYFETNSKVMKLVHLRSPLHTLAYHGHYHAIELIVSQQE